MQKIIEVENLSKAYENVQAVRGMSFYVEQGALFAFLGPNGAGKSTTINMVCTFLRPDGGAVRVNGFELGKEDNEIRRSIGAVFQESLMDNLLTVKENLIVRGSFYHMRGAQLQAAIQRAAEATEIEAILKRPYGKLSGGQRRRVDIARALLHTPKILFLDEPTTGLDPQTRKNVWDTIKKLQRDEGMTVFLTTHYMEEAEDADYCIIVDDGQIAAQGKPYALKACYAKDRLRLKSENPEKLKAELEKTNISCFKKADILEIELERTLDALSILNTVKPLICDFTVAKGSLNDVFINITGKEIRE